MPPAEQKTGRNEPLSVDQNPSKMAVRALGALVFAGICGAIGYPGGVLGEPPIFIGVIGLFGAVFFGFAGSWMLIKTTTTLLGGEPALVIDSDGLRDHSSALSAGDLHWNEIDQISTVMVSGQPMLAIFPTNMDEYISSQNLLKRSLMRINLSLIGAPVAIAYSNVSASRDELLTAIEQYHSVESE